MFQRIYSMTFVFLLIIAETILALPSNHQNLSLIWLPIPHNISLVLTQWYPPAVRVSWSLDLKESPQQVRAVRIRYNTRNSRFRKITEVPPNVQNVTLENLQPNREYQVELSVVSDSGATNSSPVINFISPSNDSKQGAGNSKTNRWDYYDTQRSQLRGNFNYRLRTPPVDFDFEMNRTGPLVRVDEVIIVVFVLCFWMAVIYLFCNKWGKIRHLEPYQPQYQPETPFQSPVYSIHGPKPSRMNTCNSVNCPLFAATSKINIQSSFERQRTFSQGSKIGSLYHCASAYLYQAPIISRSRNNSVFVDMSPLNHQRHHASSPLERKFKSAEDIKSYSVRLKLPEKKTSNINMTPFNPYFRH